jgi:hypothetical protein
MSGELEIDDKDLRLSLSIVRDSVRFFETRWSYRRMRLESLAIFSTRLMVASTIIYVAIAGTRHGIQGFIVELKPLWENGIPLFLFSISSWAVTLVGVSLLASTIYLRLQLEKQCLFGLPLITFLLGLLGMCIMAFGYKISYFEHLSFLMLVTFLVSLPLALTLATRAAKAYETLITR